MIACNGTRSVPYAMGALVGWVRVLGLSVNEVVTTIFSVHFLHSSTRVPIHFVNTRVVHILEVVKNFNKN